jgi:hypothetical protein
MKNDIRRHVVLCSLAIDCRHARSASHRPRSSSATTFSLGVFLDATTDRFGSSRNRSGVSPRRTPRLVSVRTSAP